MYYEIIIVTHSVVLKFLKLNIIEAIIRIYKYFRKIFDYFKFTDTWDYLKIFHVKKTTKKSYKKFLIIKD